MTSQTKPKVEDGSLAFYIYMIVQSVVIAFATFLLWGTYMGWIVIN